MDILYAISGAVFSLNTLLIITVVVLLLGAIVITPGKHAKVIERLGKPMPKARMPGFSLKIPVFDQVVASINLQQQEIGENVSVKTSDNAFMTLPIKVQYRADSTPEGAVRAHYELENPEQQMISYVLNNARQTASTMSMVELYQNRDNIEKEVLKALQEQFAQYGYEIANVLVDEPQPSKEVRDAFNRVIASERAKEAAQNIADAKRIELVGIAKAEKESKELQGQGVAGMRRAIFEGLEADFKKLEDAGMSADDAQQMVLETIRLDTLGSAATHGNMVLVDMQGDNGMAKTIAAVRAASPGTSVAPVSPTSADSDAA